MLEITIHYNWDEFRIIKVKMDLNLIVKCELKVEIPNQKGKKGTHNENESCDKFFNFKECFSKNWIWFLFCLQ